MTTAADVLIGLTGVRPRRHNRHAAVATVGTEPLSRPSNAVTPAPVASTGGRETITTFATQETVVDTNVVALAGLVPTDTFPKEGLAPTTKQGLAASTTRVVRHALTLRRATVQDKTTKSTVGLVV